jgi:hypothetical protein
MLVKKSHNNDEKDLYFSLDVTKSPHVAEPDPVIHVPLLAICLAISFRTLTFPSSASVRFEIFECCRSARSL